MVLNNLKNQNYCRHHCDFKHFRHLIFVAMVYLIPVFNGIVGTGLIPHGNNSLNTV
jgi:hypothetical protein